MADDNGASRAAAATVTEYDGAIHGTLCERPETEVVPIGADADAPSGIVVVQYRFVAVALGRFIVVQIVKHNPAG